MRARRGSIALLGALLAVAAVGCATTDPTWLGEAGELLDDMAEALDEFGHVTMSNPILSRPDERFAFNLTKGGADRYFEEAKKDIQGKAGYSEQVVQAFYGGVRGRGNLAEFMKFQEALELHRLDLRRVASRDRLLDSAALDEYAAAVAAAGNEPDETKRAELIAAAKRTLATKQVQPSESPTFPADPGLENVPGPATGIAKPPTDAKAILTQDKFQAAGALLGEGTPVIANRQALITAAGDQAVESIFRVLGRPDEAQRFADKVAFFGVSTVAVAPGRATRTGFAAEVATAAELVYRAPPRELLEKFLTNAKYPKAVRKNVAYGAGLGLLDLHELDPSTDWAKVDGRWQHGWARRFDVADEWRGHPYRDVPMIAAISPLTDVQTYDTTNSTRRRTEFAFNLSIALRYAGLVGEAEAFEQYVRNVEKDVATRTPEVSVTAFTNGSLFGYQIGPQLRALGDLSDDDPETEYVLGRQSFPVLLVVGLDREDFAIKVYAGDYLGDGKPEDATLGSVGPLTSCQPCNGANPAAFCETCAAPREGLTWCKGKVAGQRLRLLVPQLRFTQVSRWVPLESGSSNRGLRESDRLEWMSRAGALYAHSRPTPETGDTATFVEDQLHYRKNLLQHHIFGSNAAQDLPRELIDGDEATITSIVPQAVTLERGDKAPFKQVKLVLLGENLSRLRRGVGEVKVIVGEVAIEKELVLEGEGALALELTVKKAGPVILGLKDETGRVALITQAIQLAAPPDQPEAKAVFKAAVPARLVASTAAVQTLVFLGEHLDQLVMANPKLGSGAPATILKAERLSSGAVQVEVSGTVPGPLVIVFGRTKGGELATPPVEVVGPGGPTKVTYERTKDGKTDTRSVQFDGSQSGAQTEAAKEVFIELDDEKDQK